MNNELVDMLITLYGAWCAQQGLECTSADEMLAMSDLTAEQRKWLETFSDLWEQTAS